MQIRLLLFAVRVTARDALLGFPIGSAVRLQYPNGGERREALGPRAELTLTSLPRGDYRVGVEALGISSSRPVALSRDQDVSLRVISWLDVAVVLLGLGSVALALLFARRPASVRRAGGVSTLLVVLVAVAMAGGAPARAAVPPDPVFAYYYIWFNQGSWNRAKVDYPLLGRYSSDDRDVMRRHVEWAKRAGIDGFIVSWKSTPVLNRRLERLAEVAAAEQLQAARHLPGARLRARAAPGHTCSARSGSVPQSLCGCTRIRRLRQAARHLVRYAPLLPRRAGPRDAARAAVPPGPRVGAQRARLSPRRRSGGRERLLLGLRQSRRPIRAIRKSSRTWAGRSVGRPACGSLRPPRASTRDWSAGAVSSSAETVRRCAPSSTPRHSSGPDAVGLISWNEFSENTHVEPSERYGRRYLDVVADVRDARLPELRDFDSSEPAATEVNYGLPLLGGIALFLAGGLPAARASRPAASPALS